MINPVWPFTKQLPKYGYINNPNWTDEVADPSKHQPCGYWHGGDRVELNMPTLSYSLYSCGRDNQGSLGRTVTGTDFRVFMPLDEYGPFNVISIGNCSSLFIKYDNTLWGLGLNQGGQLGTGDKDPLLVITQIGTESDWLSVSRDGSLYSLALKTDGSIWSCGQNDHGELGLDSTTEMLTFQRIGTDSDWKFIYGLSYSSYAIKSNGDLYSWGDGTNGNLGHDNTVEYHIPTQVFSNGEDFDSITGGYYNAIGLKAGKIWSCGSNIYGHLCLDNTTATRVFTERTEKETWISVHSCGKHVILIKSDGTLWGVGLNIRGCLGLNDQTNRTVVTLIDSDTSWIYGQACGLNGFSMAMKNDGSLWSCGYNDYGQLGLGWTNPQGPLVFTEIGGVWGSITIGATHSIAGKEVFEWA